MTAPRRNEVAVAVITGPRPDPHPAPTITLTITRSCQFSDCPLAPSSNRLVIDLPASTAARLALVTLKTGVSAEALILDLLDDHIFSQPSVS